MIKSFRKKYLEECFHNGQCTRVPTELRSRIFSKLDMMHAAISLEDLAKVPGNKLHRLKGDRQSEYALHVSGKWCLVFRYNRGDFYDVALEQYH